MIGPIARTMRLAARAPSSSGAAVGAVAGRAIQAQTPAPTPSADPRIQALVAAISVDRMKALDTTLVGFGTRNTLSNATSTTRGIGAARQWIFDELKRSSAKLQVSFDTYQIAPQGRITRPVELRNVMAVLPGRSPRRIYVSGHYDSLNLGAGGQLASATRAPQAGGAAGAAAAGLARAAPADPQQRPGIDYDIDAPGANDDGSGTVLTMELARVFAESGLEFDATLVFICWAGEEQGLIGSAAHAQRIAAEKVPVEAMILERHRRQLARRHRRRRRRERARLRGRARGLAGARAGALHRRRRRDLRAVAPGPADGPRGSLRARQRPGVVHASRAIRRSSSARPTRTSTGSTRPATRSTASISPTWRRTRASTPPRWRRWRWRRRRRSWSASAARARIGRDPSGYDAALRWTPSPGATGYRVYWRDTWRFDWQHARTVGNVTEVVLPGVSIDDWVFGVAAIGAGGHESLVSAYVSPVRPGRPIELVK